MNTVANRGSVESEALAVEPQIPPCAHVPQPYEGPPTEKVLADRRQYCNPAVFTYYQEPLMIVEGLMQYLYDHTGRRYLDLFAGIATVSCGHCHPKVLRRIQQQAATLQHATTIYTHPNLAEFAGKLADRMPPGLEVTYCVNSGSEANELALMMARLYTGNFDVIALENAYHGGTDSTLGLAGLDTWRYPLPQAQGILHAPCPDPYRSPFEGTPEQVAHAAAEAVRDLIRNATPGRVAGLIAEPIQGVGGVTHGAPNYLKEVYAIVREHGGVCIADEVQTGLGRTGDHFWGFENHGVVPDIVTMAKGLGNGVPLAAVTTRREIARTLAQRRHINTFGGNPVSMAAGAAVLDVIEEEGLMENARVVGGQFKTGLQKLMEKHRLIGDVRGMGLMLGLELVRDRQNKEPAETETARVMEEARAMGALLGRGGLHGNVLRIKPPMCITREDADFALEVLDRALDIVEKE